MSEIIQIIPPLSNKSQVIVFAKGFLTQDSTFDEHDAWVKALSQVALSLGYGLSYIKWDAQSVSNNKIRNIRDRYKLIQQSIDTWRAAVKASDIASKQLRLFLRQAECPITLIGHSLGARLILRAAEFVPQNSIHKMIALAPAYDQSECKFERVIRAVTTKPIIMFSRKDYILSEMFSLNPACSNVAGGLTALRNKDTKGILVNLASILSARITSAPLGIMGVPKKFEHSFICIDKTPYSHFEYSQNIESVLHDHLINP